MKVTIKRLVLFGLVAAVLGTGAYFAVQFAVAQVGHESAINYLRTDNRTQLSVCVDGAGGLVVSDAEVEKVRQTLDEALNSFPNVPPAYLDDLQIAAPQVPPQYLQRQVVSGCPAPRALTATPSNPSDWSFDFGVVVPGPEAASEHRVFVYFVQGDAYAASFANAPYATTVEEFVCGGDVCEGVTRGLYVPAGVPGDALQEGLLFALNLLTVRTSDPLPEADDLAACERGEVPYPYHSCAGLEDWARDMCGQEKEPVPPWLDCTRWSQQ